MNDPAPGHDGVVHPSVKYEQSDLPLSGVLLFSAALAGVIAVVCVGLYYMVPAFLGPTPPPKPLTSNAEGPWKDWGEQSPASTDPVRDSRLPPPPELEGIDRIAPTGPADKHTRPIQDQIREEEAWLEHGGWVDEKNGIAAIPIEDAMRRLGGEPGQGPPDRGPRTSPTSTSGREATGRGR